jgi:hypothetical protein
MVFTEWNVKFFKCLYFYLTITKPIWKATLILFKSLIHRGESSYGSTYSKPRNWMEENGLLQTHTTLFPDKEVLPLLITVAIK